ncbi:hypothetical protein M885DRAFT_551662 [Pelagophyceae sp. CCMP2097]|nr:hypothetical protein M885DRAFT_551662 [Pelagophyceae sp. CCMP2097]|mmetsp:Transcript_12061/g.40226  ORF Transcript_12061/g.40226 Transcript_12061/m.40226 type:complete len:148 (-) Transcript_12061:22-465(-)
MLGEIRKQSKNAVIPCTFGNDRVADDFVVAAPVAMRAYAARLTGPFSAVCEAYAGAVLRGDYIVEKLEHAILDFPSVNGYVERAEYKTATLHARCLTKNTKPARRGRDVAAFNSTDFDIVRRFVSKQIAIHVDKADDRTMTELINVV